MTLQDDALKIIYLAKEKGMELRLMGSIAFQVRCPNFSFLFKKLGRDKFPDIDFVALSKQWSEIIQLIKDLGYIHDERRTYLHPKRVIFYSQNEDSKIEIFFDELQMCHTIDLRNRLIADHQTLPLADLLLQKMQIVEINKKDVIDTLVLLREHNVGETDNKTLNCDYIAKLLSDNWGFYYTVTANLKRIRDEFLPTFPALSKEDIEVIDSRIEAILKRIEKAPKSLKWKIRSKIGTKKKWFNEVEEITR